MQKTTPTPAVTESALLPDLGVVVVLRPARLADVYRAAAQVDPPTQESASAAESQAYQWALDDMQVLCQIVSVGDGGAPESLADFAAELTPDDMGSLRFAAQELKKKQRLWKSVCATGASLSVPSSSEAGASTTSAAPT